MINAGAWSGAAKPALQRKVDPGQLIELLHQQQVQMLYLISPFVTGAAILFSSGSFKRDEHALQNTDALPQPFAISDRADDLLSRLAKRRSDNCCARSLGNRQTCFPRSTSLFCLRIRSKTFTCLQ